MTAEYWTTFHVPCHTCGQPVEIIDTVEQPHTCRTYETDAERICAAYWAGFDRANLPTGVNGGTGCSSPDGADDAPDEPKESQATSPGHDAPAPVGSQYRVVEVEQEFRALDAAREAGRQSELADLEQRMTRAIENLEDLAAMQQTVGEHKRLKAKASGVNLARSYVREALR